LGTSLNYAHRLAISKIGKIAEKLYAFLLCRINLASDCAARPKYSLPTLGVVLSAHPRLLHFIQPPRLCINPLLLAQVVRLEECFFDIRPIFFRVPPILSPKIPSVHPYKGISFLKQPWKFLRPQHIGSANLPSIRLHKRGTCINLEPCHHQIYARLPDVS